MIAKLTQITHFGFVPPKNVPQIKWLKIIAMNLGQPFLENCSNCSHTELTIRSKSLFMTHSSQLCPFLHDSPKLDAKNTRNRCSVTLHLPCPGGRKTHKGPTRHLSLQC